MLLEVVDLVNVSTSLYIHRSSIPVEFNPSKAQYKIQTRKGKNMTGIKIVNNICKVQLVLKV